MPLPPLAREQVQNAISLGGKANLRLPCWFFTCHCAANKSPCSNHTRPPGCPPLGLALRSPAWGQCGSFTGSGDDRHLAPHTNATMERDTQHILIRLRPEVGHPRMVNTPISENCYGAGTRLRPTSRTGNRDESLGRCTGI